MGLKGDLQNLNLADVFQGLANNEQQGTLVVSDGESTKHIYFQGGKVCFLASGKKRGLKLGRILARRGKATLREIEIAMNKQARLGGVLGEILVEMGLCTEEEIVAAVRFQIQEEIFSLFTWKNATFEFLETLPDEAIFNDERLFSQTSFDVGGLLLEAARRVDEWERIEEKIPSFKEIYKVIDDNSSKTTKALTQNDHEGIILGLIDGRRDVEEVIEEAAIGYFETCNVITELLSENRIEPVRYEELIKAAQQFKEAEQSEKAIQFYLRAVEMKPRDIERRLELAEVYRQQGENRCAVDQLKEVAVIYSGLREMERAADVLSQAEELIPGDVDSTQRLYEIYIEMNETDRAIAAGRELAQRLRRSGDLLRKKEIFETLVRLKPSDRGLRKLLINNYLDMGDVEKAVDQYEILAESLLAEGRTDKVVEIYKKILTCDPKRHDIKWRLENLFAGETRKLRRQRYIVTGAIAAAFLALIATYQFLGSHKLNELLPKVQAAVIRKDYNRAITHYEAVLSSYPLTLSALEANHALTDLQSDQKAEQKKRDEVLVKVERYESQGNTEAARELLAQLVKEYSGTIHSTFLEKRLEVLSESMTAAERLYQQGRSYEKTGNVRMAFEAFSRLFWNYGNSKYAQNIKFPVRVETKPSGAKVTINGKTMGRTPLTFSYDPTQEFALELIQPNFAPVRINTVTSWLVSETLPRLTYWNYKTTQPVEGSGTVVGDTYIIGGRDGHVYCFDIASGTKRWDYYGGSISDVVSGIVQGDNAIYFGSVNGTLTALHPLSGRKLWSYNTGQPVRTTPTYVKSLGVVIVTGGEGLVHVVSAISGKKQWQFNTGTDIIQSGVVVDSHFYFGDFQGKLTCYDLTEKQKVWSVNLDGPVQAAPAEAAGTLFVGTSQGTVYALRETDGGQIWKQTVGGEIFGSPALDGQKVYVGTSSYRVVALNKETGAEQWVYKSSGQIYSSPTLHNDTVYVGGIDGYFYALDASRGTLKWLFRAGGPVYGAASILKNRVLFGSSDYSVYALAR